MVFQQFQGDLDNGNIFQDECQKTSGVNYHHRWYRFILLFNHPVVRLSHRIKLLSPRCFSVYIVQYCNYLGYFYYQLKFCYQIKVGNNFLQNVTVLCRDVLYCQLVFVPTVFTCWGCSLDKSWPSVSLLRRYTSFLTAIFAHGIK